MTAQALTPPATQAPSVASAPSSAPPTAHAAPAAQVAPALLSLATSATGTQRLTLRLEPADLGTVQVRIDRPTEAPARVEISVSRPETLTLMLRDQTQLQHALDQAGVPAEGRSVSFHLASQDADSLSRQAGGFDRSDADGQTSRNGTGPGHTAPGDTDASDDASLLPPTPMRWQRVGLDITA
jgi:flagellar hook-length control protein FliK